MLIEISLADIEVDIESKLILDAVDGKPYHSIIDIILKMVYFVADLKQWVTIPNYK